MAATTTTVATDGQLADPDWGQSRPATWRRFASHHNGAGASINQPHRLATRLDNHRPEAKKLFLVFVSAVAGSRLSAVGSNPVASAGRRSRRRAARGRRRAGFAPRAAFIKTTAGPGAHDAACRSSGATRRCGQAYRSPALSQANCLEIAASDKSDSMNIQLACRFSQSGYREQTNAGPATVLRLRQHLFASKSTTTVVAQQRDFKAASWPLLASARANEFAPA